MLPDRLESGTANLPGIAGLTQGLKFMLRHRGAVTEYEQTLRAKLREGLLNISGVTVYEGPADAAHTGVISFNLRGMDSGQGRPALRPRHPCLAGHRRGRPRQPGALQHRTGGG